MSGGHFRSAGDAHCRTKLSGSFNRYFVTIEQRRTAVFRNGGFCVPNKFYDGRPVTTAEERSRRAKPLKSEKAEARSKAIGPGFNKKHVRRV